MHVQRGTHAPDSLRPRVPPQLTISEPSKIVTAASLCLPAWHEPKLRRFEWSELIFAFLYRYNVGLTKTPGGEARGSVAPRLLPKLLCLGVDVNAQWARRSGVALIGVGHVARVLVA